MLIETIFSTNGGKFMQLCDQFDSKGYFIIEKTISSESIKMTRRTIEKLICKHSRANENFEQTIQRLDKEESNNLYEIYKVSNKTAAMNQLRQECLTLIKEVFHETEEKVLIDVDSHIIFCTPQNDRLTWGWHQESSYDDYPTNLFGVNICIPIFSDATIENGTMSLLENSHLLGHLPSIDFKPYAKGSTTKIPQNIEKIAQDHKEVFFEGSPGDAILFHRHMIHTSNLNSSRNTRITAVIRFLSL